MSVSRLERLDRELKRAVREGDLDLALAVTDDMVGIEPDSSRHHTSRGVVLAKLQRTEEALEELDTALELDAEDGRAWYSKGCILMDAARPRPALACFYKSLDIDPENIRARDRFLKSLEMMQDEIGKDSPGPMEPESFTGSVMEDTVEEGILMKDPVGDSGIDDTHGSLEPSWKDMIEPEGGKGPERESQFVERPPLPDEEPDIFGGRDRGSLLDEDLFEDDDDAAEFEEWEEDEEDWPEDEEEGWENEEEDSEPVGVIKCRCGADIPIYSEDRPCRFECPGCGRTGTLK